MQACILLHLPARLEARRQAEAKLRTMCLEGGYPPKVMDELVSAFIEAFNNVVIHAYKGREDGQVDVMIQLSDESAIIELSDTGRGFDMASVPPAPHPDHLQEGGYGLHI